MPADIKITDDEYDDLSTRLIHIGFTRRSIQSEGAFYWDEWVEVTVPRLLIAFRDFLTRLSPHYRALFLQPNPDAPQIDLVAEIDKLIGPGTTRSR